MQTYQGNAFIHSLIHSFVHLFVYFFIWVMPLILVFIIHFFTGSMFISHVAPASDDREMNHDRRVIIHSGEEWKRIACDKHLLCAKEFDGLLIELVQK